MSFTTRTVVATYLNPDSSPCEGFVDACLSVDITDGADDYPVIAIRAYLDDTGTATWSIPANDDSTTQPVGSYYDFIEWIEGASVNVRRAVIPSAGAGSVELLTISPTVTSPSYSYDLAGSAAAAQAAAEAFALAHVGNAITRSTPAGSIAVLGDSITAYNFVTGAPQKQSNGFGTWASLFTDQRLTIAYNEGVPGSGCMNPTWGQRVANTILTGLQTCVVEIGTNDVDTGGTFAQIVNGTGLTAGCGLAPTLAAFRAAGVLVCICTIPPGDERTVAQALITAQVNSWIREQSQSPGVLVCDAANVLTDPYLGETLNANLSTALVPATQYIGTVLGQPSADVTIATTGNISMVLTQPIPVATHFRLVSVISGVYTSQYFYVTATAVPNGSTPVAIAVTSYAGAAPTFPHATTYFCTTISLDGIHPNSVGARLWGKELARTLDSLLPKVAPILPTGDVGGATGWNILEESLATWSPGTNTWPYAGFVSGQWWWSTPPSGGVPVVTQTPRTDDVPGNWTCFTIPAGQSGTLEGYATAFGSAVTNFPDLHAGETHVAFVEMGFTGAVSPNQVANAPGAVLGLNGWTLQVQMSGADNINPYNGPSPIPHIGLLQTPLYLGTAISAINGMTQGNTYTSVTIFGVPGDWVTVAIPSGTSLLLAGYTDVLHSQYVVTNGVTLVGATVIHTQPFVAQTSYVTGGTVVYRTSITPVPVVSTTSLALTVAGATGTAAGTWTGTAPGTGATNGLLTGVVGSGGAVISGQVYVLAVAGSEEAGTFTTAGSGSVTTVGTVTAAAASGLATRYIQLTLYEGTYWLGRVGIRKVQAAL